MATVLPHVLTLEFTNAVDGLVQDATVLDSALHVRAQRYLGVFCDSETNAAGPAWAERIHRSSPGRTLFTTPRLFAAMYRIADELGGLVSGKRYVSAAVCVCGERARVGGAQAGAGPPWAPEQATRLAHALHELASAWVAFVLWPFYAQGHDDDTTYSWEEDLPSLRGDDTPTAERVARAQAKARRRRCEEQVRERDDYRCFMTGVYDSKWCHRRPFPADARFLCCSTVSIIPPEVWAHEDADLQDIVLGMLTRFCAVDDTVLTEKASEGPHNTLFVYVAAEDGFKKLLWSLHPTEMPHRYEIKSYQPSWDEGCRHITSHVTFVDHSVSPSLLCHSESDAGVDLPDRELLRVHAALAHVLHRSGARDAFAELQYSAGDACPAGSGSAFWGSVVAYDGPEICRGAEAERVDSLGV